MQSYDHVPGFNYWSIDAWKDFIAKHILPLNTLTTKLIKLRDIILDKIGYGRKVLLSEVERKGKEILPFLLGGIREDGEYKPNSLARLTRLAFGIYINPKEWVTLEREEGMKASDHIYVNIVDTQFLEFLKELNEITREIIKLANIEPKEVSEEEIKEIIQQPEKILEILRDIYIKCLEVSANHNYYTFFALSTKSIPFIHLITAYPKLVENFEVITEFLGLEKIFEPDIEGELKEKYTIWGHVENGLCSQLYKLNKAIWDNFASGNTVFTNINIRNVFSYITTEVRDLKEEYKRMVKAKIGKWPPEGTEIVHKWGVEYYLEVHGPWITRCYNTYSPTYYKHVDVRVKMSLIEFLTKVGSGLFLGQATLRKETENLLEYYGFVLGELK